MSDTNVFKPILTWTDKSFPLSRASQGANQKPDFDFTNIGLLFPQNDPSEKIYILNQMDHRKVFGSQLRLHVHFIQSEVNIPNFVCEYKFWINGEPVPESPTIIQTDDGPAAPFPYTSGSILQIVNFPFFDPPVNEEVSTHLEMVIYRNDNRVTGDVLTKYVDYHYLFTTYGSRFTFKK